MSSEKPSNPPAFPQYDPNRNTSATGMTLRDWMAGQALIAWFSQAQFSVLGKIARDERMSEVGVMARLAYEQADAMLAERERTS